MKPDSRVPALRRHPANDLPVNPEGNYVLYWMIAARRVRWNYAFDRAVEWAAQLGRPLVVFEPLRNGYRWASDRLHRFVIDGMSDNAAALAGTGVHYYPYVEPEPDHGKGLLAALSAHAALVVTDEFPCFMLPRMVEAAARQVPVRMESIDGNGILPLRAPEGRVFSTAFAFRRFLQGDLPQWLEERPRTAALRGRRLPPIAAIPENITDRWPPASDDLLAGGSAGLASLPIDHSVAPAPFRGGRDAGTGALERFVEERLGGYAADRNDLTRPATSGLSPYLHFGHVSAHEVLAAVAAREDWSVDDIAGDRPGKRTGWWRMREGAEAFLDQLVTWRELGFNMAFYDQNYDHYESLPDWARATLEEHEGDEREHAYSLEEFDGARTHDELWNAAQNQLRRDGVIHNYLRMLWGKKILHWSRSPREALDVMIELNNRYAVDGRDPNSYSGIFWTLGRYDRAWGPERPIFGKVRYMTSDNTRRKMKVDDYIARYTRPDLFDA
jgi:deoxyribodipyrimidine photo-lyase